MTGFDVDAFYWKTTFFYLKVYKTKELMVPRLMDEKNKLILKILSYQKKKKK